MSWVRGAAGQLRQRLRDLALAFLATPAAGTAASEQIAAAARAAGHCSTHAPPSTPCAELPQLPAGWLPTAACLAIAATLPAHPAAVGANGSGKSNFFHGARQLGSFFMSKRMQG